ncbi:MAG TPA: NAD(P)-dependent oxidoreductase [Solirubrobacteraceae bacterium]|nr:NAD(P)-dependent oxidoreductase [Solirubrobacteraceae bacterium]
MSRVLITGGAGMIGTAVAKRLLADPAHDVRVADERSAPLWMREGCEIRSLDLRVPAHAQAAVRGCSQVIHLASFPKTDASDLPSGLDGDAAADTALVGPAAHTLMEYENALHGAVIRAALDGEVERFLYVSSPLVFERAERFPTPEAHLAQCPAPLSARGHSRLTGERLCRAAHEEHGLAFTICRPSATYGPQRAGANEPGVSRTLIELFDGALARARPLALAGPGERTLTPTHVDDVAQAIVLALVTPAALNEDFNIAAGRELSLVEIARVVWQACGQDADELTLAPVADGDGEPARSCPAVDKARELIGWEAGIGFEDGAAAVASMRAGAGAGASGHIGGAL